jgi:hypothetical protein
MLLNATRFGDLRRSTLSWCRRERISASTQPATGTVGARRKINVKRSPRINGAWT